MKQLSDLLTRLFVDLDVFNRSETLHIWELWVVHYHVAVDAPVRKVFESVVGRAKVLVEVVYLCNTQAT